MSWTADVGSYTLKATAYDAADNADEDEIQVVVAAGGGGTGPTHHSGEVEQDETWYPSGNPHILDSDVYTGDNVTLTTMPGCIMQFSADVELYCGYSNPGSIVAVGTPDSMIAFTSLTDTVPGFWQDISFYSYTISTARMSYCNILFGGKTSDKLGAVRVVDQTSIKFDNNLVRKSGYNGVWVSPTGYFGDFTDNTITNCAEYALHIGANNVGTLGTGNTLTGNAENGIEVDGTHVDADATWLNQGVPYVVTDDVAIDNDDTVTIEPGCTIALDRDVEFCVGYSSPCGLIAEGTPTESITSTSSVNPPSPGDWSRLSFYSYSVNNDCQLSYCNVWYGGSDSRGNIYIHNRKPTITSCDIGYGASYGIYLEGDTTNCLIRPNCGVTTTSASRRQVRPPVRGGFAIPLLVGCWMCGRRDGSVHPGPFLRMDGCTLWSCFRCHTRAPEMDGRRRQKPAARKAPNTIGRPGLRPGGSCA